MNTEGPLTDPTDDLDRRLRVTLTAIMPLLDLVGPDADRPDAAHAPIAAFESRPVRARPRILLTAVACLTVVALVAALALVARGRQGAGRATAFEQAVRASGALTPDRVPAGLRFDSLFLGGGLATAGTTAPTPASGREVVLTDPADPNRQVRIFGFRNSDDGADWESSTRQFVQTTVDGARGAAYGMSDTGTVSLLWAKDGHRFDLTSFGLDLDTLRTLATGVGFEVAGALAVDHQPAGTTIAYEGPAVLESPLVQQNWLAPSGDRSLVVTLGGDTPWSAPSFRLGRGEIVHVGGHDALYYDTPSQRTVAWLDSSGRPYEVMSSGLDRTALLDVADKLVPLDSTRLRALRAQARPGGFPDAFDGATTPGGASPATTALATGIPRPSGFVDTGVRAVDVPPGHLAELNSRHIVHTTDDRWLAIDAHVEATGGEGCNVEPDRAGDGTLLGWHAPCTGARYAPDGTCIDERCAVGLRTVDVRVNDGRIEADDDRFHVGVSRVVSG